MNTAFNLLPWRTRRRKRRWRYSLLALTLSALAGGLSWWSFDAAITTRLQAQRQHNQTLRGQLATLTARIDTFEHHRQQQHALAIAHARLERERLFFPHLLETLSRHTPAGVVLTEVQQHGGTLTLTAHALTHAQIAHTVQQWSALQTGTPTLTRLTTDAQDGHVLTLSLPWPAAFDAEQGAGRIQLAQTGAGP